MSKEDKTFNIMFAGVGGQGLMLLSAILGKAAVDSGFKVMTGEQHGLSQRQGSIYVHFRIGNPISPLIPYGKADMMIAMEASEALRYVEYLKEGGVVIMSNRIMPAVTETEQVALDKEKKTKYLTVEQIVEKLEQVTSNVVLLDSLDLAIQAGNVRTENSVLVGATVACSDFPIHAEEVRKAVLALVPPKTLDANSKAFDLGLEASTGCLQS
ncbi:MAG: indolepyruvate ferredoxin oxidoreductase subunit beta [Candidatus Thorarchaeota archaeon]|nr:MAG: indolepyruvate ferredoxin oxidoreductase subunit beta [Candidatus Thorarchaeota archaeon]